LLTVELADLKAYEDHLYERIYCNPLEMIKIMEDTIRIYLKDHYAEFPFADDREWQVAIRSDELPRKLREVNSNMVSKLFSVSGIIISTTKPYIKASKLKLKCRNCQVTKVIELAPGQNPYVPAFCQGQSGVNQKCPNDPFVAMPDS
jgi:DNA replicative helicase MCM subunit Mcm2 (Cdc46/Mcm family)